jgi:alpha-D-ribose 1-methylphosphonate 5-triphosphate synthase subunit PhnH
VTTALSGTGARVGALRRTPSASQRDFTTLLDVLSRPGKVGCLAVPDGVPAVALAAAEVALHVLDGVADDGSHNPESPADTAHTAGAVSADDSGVRGWGAAVHAVTNAPRTELEFARTVLALRRVTADEVRRLPRGDALNPERGARLFAAVAGLEAEGSEQDGSAPGGPAPAGAPADADAVPLRLTGPGVREERLLTVRGLPAGVFTALAAVNDAFPLGVDTFLVAPDGSVAGLPRSTRIVVGGV